MFAHFLAGYITSLIVICLALFLFVSLPRFEGTGELLSFFLLLLPFLAYVKRETAQSLPTRDDIPNMAS